MRMSRAFWRTLREFPAGAEVASHGLLLRAGFIHQLGAGIFTLLPLGRRASDRVEDIMRDEMESIGGQEVTMPVVNPAEVWKETGRWFQIGDEMGRFTDRVGREMALAMTHEEVLGDLTRNIVQSYRQLPQTVFHIQTKWRDDPRPRAGLIRVREFVMKDSYSLDAGPEGLDEQYQSHNQAYFNIFHRCGIPVVSVLADVGMMGGSASHEFMYLTPAGEDTLLLCNACGHTANRQVAEFRKPTPEAEEPLPMEVVETPDTPTIERLAQFLGVPKSRTAKAVFKTATKLDAPEGAEQLVLALVRGDMELSETKLRNLIGARDMRPASDEEIAAIGAVPGFASAVGLVRTQDEHELIVVADDLLPDCPNLVAGANQPDRHLRNVMYGRDYEADIVADIVSADPGHACPECESEMHTERGVEVGNIFKLGTRYSDALGCTYLDADGTAQPVWMGSYGIGSGRLLACIAEENRDESGLVWPISVAPYQVHLVALSGGDEEAQGVYEELIGADIDVLYDDRNESAGVKFNDADLLGMPIRLTVSTRSIKQGGVEMQLRRGGDPEILAREAVQARIRETIAALREEFEPR